MDAARSHAPNRAHRLAKLAAGGLGRVVLLAAILVLAATYIPSLLGYQRYVLVGHSMEPTIHRGSLVFDETVPAAAISRGDVVTYVPPGLSRPVTHRIVSRRHLDGRLVFRTKGDNNPIADPHPFAFNERTQARYAFSIPYLGYLFIVLADPSARLWLAVIPGILLALFAVARVWRQGGELLRDQAGAGAA